MRILPRSMSETRPDSSISMSITLIRTVWTVQKLKIWTNPPPCELRPNHKLVSLSSNASLLGLGPPWVVTAVQIILVGLRKEMAGGVKMVTSDTLVADRMNSKDFSTNRAFGSTQRIIIPILMQSTPGKGPKATGMFDCTHHRKPGNHQYHDSGKVGQRKPLVHLALGGGILALSGTIGATEYSTRAHSSRCWLLKISWRS